MKLLNPNHVISESFEVYRLNRSLIVYIEASKKLEIEVEAGWDSTYFLSIYLSSCNNWIFPIGLKISESEKKVIFENLIIAFDFMKTRVKIE